MNPRDLLKQMAIGRILIGTTMVVRPPLAVGRWVGRVGSKPGGEVLSRALGARDAALGAGTLAAMSGGNGALRPWIVGSLVADTTDLLSTHAARDDLPRGAALMIYVLAGGAIAAGLANLAGGSDTPA
jgi:hypothetical protein